MFVHTDSKAQVTRLYREYCATAMHMRSY